jgi:glycosyltransferase involved in cell wall biosynthesis
MNKYPVLLYLGDSVIKRHSGVGKYRWNIINALKGSFDIVFTQMPDKDINFPSNANIIIINNLFKKIIGLLKIFLPFDLFFPGYKLIITDSYTPIIINKKTLVFTIVHDLMCLTEKYNYSIKSRIYFYFAVKTYKRADKIIAVSNNTKNELTGLLRIKSDNIAVIPNITNFNVNRSLTEDYFIYIGEMRKNKNLANTISGFIEYKNNSKSNLRLIICGKKDFEYENLQKTVIDSKYCKDIIFTGYINDDQKKVFFSKTRGLVLLSNNEGFGIPAIEAVTNYIPVLVSDIPVMREVLSNTGIFIDQKDISAIAGGFSALENFVVNDGFKASCDEIKNKYSVSTFDNLFNELLDSINEPALH